MSDKTEFLAHYEPDRRTWMQRFIGRMFPARHCFAPEAPAEWEDCISIRSVTSFSWLDRLRVLVTGVVVTETRTITEHTVGLSATASVCYPGRRRDLE